MTEQELREQLTDIIGTAHWTGFIPYAMFMEYSSLIETSDFDGLVTIGTQLGLISKT